MPSIGEPPKITDSEEKLIEKMMINRADITGGYYPLAKAFLEMKAHQAEARQTKKLVFATLGLVVATIALVVATFHLADVTQHPAEQNLTGVEKPTPNVKN